MTVKASEIRSPGATTAEVSVPSNAHWRGAWVLLTVVLVALAALIAFALWIDHGGLVDADAVMAAQPAMQVVFRYFGFEFVGDALGFAAILVVSALALSRDRSNWFAWFFGGAIVIWMITNALYGLLALAVDGHLLTAWTPELAWFASAGLSVFPTVLTVAFAFFPHGRFPASAAWRRALQASLSIYVVLDLVALLHPGQILLAPDDPPLAFTNPFGLEILAGFDPSVVQFGNLILTVVVLASVVRTYVRSGSEVRNQIKWIVAAIPLIAVFSTLMDLIDTPWEGLPVMVALWLLALALGVAVTKYRLYEIDLIINRALVYASLAIFIGVVYVSIVVGVGTVIGSGDEPNPALAIAATAAVAVGFQPVRRRLERVASRLVFGRKATPYEVLSDFSRRVAATDDSLLGAVARSLVDGTSADRAVVAVRVDGELVESAIWPETGEDPGGEALVMPIEHEGIDLGILRLMPASGQKLSEEDVRLAGQVASGMGLTLRNRILTERLQNRVDELRESRRRLVAVQDETRRKLERDLHDGAQQQIVALKVKLGLSRMIAEKEGAVAASKLLQEMGEEADDTVESLRDFARGVYPPLLEAEGLAAAISAQARRSPLPVNVDSSGIGRYAKDVEATVYFCVVEALRRSVLRAGATRADVRLSQLDGSVTFEVGDDGGVEPAPGAATSDVLVLMHDRVDALAGTLAVEYRPGEGTTIAGSIPVWLEVG